MSKSAKRLVGRALREQRDLSNPANAVKFKKAAGEFTIRVSKSKSAALRILRKEGILTAGGKLSAKYKA
jgi:hypothetical protein